MTAIAFHRTSDRRLREVKPEFCCPILVGPKREARTKFQRVDVTAKSRSAVRTEPFISCRDLRFLAASDAAFLWKDRQDARLMARSAIIVALTQFEPAAQRYVPTPVIGAEKIPEICVVCTVVALDGAHD